MTDLVAFLNARLDEDEATANGVASNSGQWPFNVSVESWHEADLDAIRAAYDRFAGERVLREVEAKRRILAEHGIHSDLEVWGCGLDYGHVAGPREGCPTVRAMAAVWRDHPDYDPAWAMTSP